MSNTAIPAAMPKGFFCPTQRSPIESSTKVMNIIIRYEVRYFHITLPRCSATELQKRRFSSGS